MQGFGGKARKKEAARKNKGRWEDNIKMDFRKMGWDATDWINLVQDRVQRRVLLNTVMNLRVP
jgi:hypothetical protein